MRVTDKKSGLYTHKIYAWLKSGKKEKIPLIQDHNKNLIPPHDHLLYKKGYKIIKEEDLFKTNKF